jgi:hypothetical protein
MLADGWLSPRALLFAGSIGVTLWLGIRAALTYARHLG